MKLTISQRAFWDINFEKLMLQQKNYQDYIIKKVFLYGTFNDLVNVIKFYGKEKVANTLTNLNHLPEKKLNFASVLFKMKKENFKCYTTKQ